MRTTTHSLLSLSYQSMLYGLGRYGRTVIVYLTLPILIRWMGRAEYGIVVVLAALTTFVDIVSDAGIPTATMRLYNDRNDDSYRAKVLGSSLVLLMGFALITAAGIWLFSSSLAGRLLQSEHNGDLVRMGAILMVLMTIFSFGDILYRIQVRPLMDSAANLLLIILQTGLALMAVGVYSMGARGYVWGQIGGAAVTIVFVALTLWSAVSLSISTAETRGLLHYSLPLIPAAVANWALVSVDRLIIPHFAGFQGVAVYDVGYKIAGLVYVVFGPVLLAWPQFAFGRMRDENAPGIFRDVLTSVAAISTFVALIVYALRWELVLKIGGIAYIRAVDVVGWILIGQVGLTLFPILSIGPRISKSTAKLAWMAGIAAVSNVGLNYLLLPRFGLVGAGIATAVAYVLQVGLAFLLGRSEFRFELDYRRLGGLVIAAVAVGACVLLIETTFGHSGLSLTLRIFDILLFPALLLAFGFVRPAQLRRMVKIAFEQLQRRAKRTGDGNAKGRPSA